MEGYLNLASTKELRAYIDPSEHSPVYTVPKRHDNYRELNFGVADTKTKINKAAKHGSWNICLTSSSNAGRN